MPSGIPVSRKTLARAADHAALPGFWPGRHKAAILAEIRHVKLIYAMVAVVAACGIADAQTVPLPRPRPAAVPLADGPVAEAAEPSACRLRLTAELAVAPSLPAIVGPGECGAPDIVRLEAVFLADQSRVTVAPPAVLRCSMAEAVVHWVREEAAPRVLELGHALRGIQNFDSYDCRGRNRVVGAKTSEHGKGNALDIRGLRLANGKFIDPTDRQLSRDFRNGLRKSVCARFTTVLGPGSDGYHENHVHIDLAERRGGYRMCQWDVRDPVETEVAGTVPLPVPRPKLDEKPSARGKL
jgi:hypothetical protein